MKYNKKRECARRIRQAQTMKANRLKKQKAKELREHLLKELKLAV